MKKGIELLINYFPNLTEKQKNQFLDFESLFLDWNSKINLISRKDEAFFYERHVLHSLTLGYYIDFVKATSIMDIGTGGGFPGIPLAILFPDVEFYLVDSIGKKIKVVNDIIQKLDLKNVKAEQIRAEQVNKTFDFVISRAVTDMNEYTKWVEKKFKPTNQNEIRNGILYLKGGDLTLELKQIGRTSIVWDLSDTFKEDFFKTKKLVYIPYTK